MGALAPLEVWIQKRGEKERYIYIFQTPLPGENVPYFSLPSRRGEVSSNCDMHRWTLTPANSSGNSCTTTLGGMDFQNLCKDLLRSGEISSDG